MKRKLNLREFKKLYNQYKKGKSAAYLCRKNQISRTLFYRYLSRLENKKPRHKLDNAQRLHLINQVIYNKKKVVHMAKLAGVSRTIYYRWKARHDAAGEGEKLYALNPKTRGRVPHPAKIAGEAEERILELVGAHPELSSHKLAQLLKGEVSNHGVQNVLSRNNLSVYESRLRFSQERRVQTREKTVPSTSWAIPLKLLRWAISPFATVPKFLFNHPLLSGLFGLALGFVLLYDLPTYERFGYSLAFVALLCGLIFFAYSLKYYFTLVLIIGFSQSKRSGGGQGWLTRFLNLFSFNKNTTLEPDLSKIKLARQPFVSIHVPFYNERRVAERILTALSNLEWDNYEIVVADDSTDATRDIIETFAHSNPRIKISHRDTRVGYKGAALSKALTITDKRTEFVIVFDADFIPFPDTVAQFMKYFAHLAGGCINDVENIKTAAVQGYQWHVLNKSENWVTRGIRTEYAGNYVVERTGAELYGGLKQIAGSVFCIRKSILDQLNWTSSITEDFNLTLRLYEEGYKVAYTPYIQTPSECVSTVQRLIRQRMRWAEGHSFNIARMFRRIMSSERITRKEKFEFLYLSPYYLQATFFLVGTFGWLMSEIVFKTHLPLWSSLLGWSLVFSNFVSLPLTNSAGLFLEESEERDYFGIGSFVLLSYILVPFQAYASVKGFLEKEEGFWFRTPKTGRITDSFNKSALYKWFDNLFPWRKKEKASSVFSFKLPAMSANQSFLGYTHKPKRVGMVARIALASLVLVTLFINYIAFFTPAARAANSTTPAIEQQINIMDQTYSTTSSTYAPTDNSLGLFTWDTSKYDGTVKAYFEAVIKTDGTASCTANTTLATSGGTAVTSGSVTSTSSTYSRQRTADISGNLTTGTNYTAQIKYTGTACTVSMQAARLIVTQTNASILKKSETSIDIGANDGAAGGSNAGPSNPKYWCYSGTTSSCTSSSTVYNPSPTAYFEASMKGPNSMITKLQQQVEIINSPGNGAASNYTNGKACIDTAKYDSIDTTNTFFEVVAINSNATTDETVTLTYGAGDGGVTCGTGTASTTTVTVTHNTSTPTRFRSATFTISTGEVYLTAKGADVSVYVARVIFNQSSASALTKTMSQIEFWNDQFTQYTSGSWYPDSQSCGIPWYYDASKFSPISNIYFEATMIAPAGGQTAYMELYDMTASSHVTGSAVSTTSTSLTRVRSGDISANLTSGHTYAIFAKTSSTTNGTFLNGKVLINQASTIYATELYQRYINGYAPSGNFPSYTSLNRPNKFDSSALSGTVTSYFEADWTQVSGSPQAQLYDNTAAAAVSGSQTAVASGGGCGGILPYTIANRYRTGAITPTGGDELDTQYKQNFDIMNNSWLINDVCACFYVGLYDLASGSVSGSEVMTQANSWSLVRSGAITLTTGHKYDYYMRASGTNNGYIANAHVILDQNSSSGISAFETYQEQINSQISTQAASATQAYYIDQFLDSNYGGTGTYYFEATMHGQAKGSQTQTANLKLRDVDTPADVSGSTISVTNATLALARSSAITPTTNKQYDSFYWCTTTGSSCATDGGSYMTAFYNNSWIIIDVTSMPVPEAALVLLPVVIFLPFIIRRMKIKSKDKDSIITAEVRNAL